MTRASLCLSEDSDKWFVYNKCILRNALKLHSYFRLNFLCLISNFSISLIKSKVVPHKTVHIKVHMYILQIHVKENILILQLKQPLTHLTMPSRFMQTCQRQLSKPFIVCKTCIILSLCIKACTSTAINTIPVEFNAHLSGEQYGSVIVLQVPLARWIEKLLPGAEVPQRHVSIAGDLWSNLLVLHH